MRRNNWFRGRLFLMIWIMETNWPKNQLINYNKTHLRHASRRVCRKRGLIQEPRQIWTTARTSSPTTSMVERSSISWATLIILFPRRIWARGILHNRGRDWARLSSFRKWRSSETGAKGLSEAANLGVLPRVARSRLARISIRATSQISKSWLLARVRVGIGACVRKGQMVRCLGLWEERIRY